MELQEEASLVCVWWVLGLTAHNISTLVPPYISHGTEI